MAFSASYKHLPSKSQILVYIKIPKTWKIDKNVYKYKEINKRETTLFQTLPAILEKQSPWC